MRPTDGRDHRVRLSAVGQRNDLSQILDGVAVCMWSYSLWESSVVKKEMVVAISAASRGRSGNPQPRSGHEATGGSVKMLPPLCANRDVEATGHDSKINNDEGRWRNDRLTSRAGRSAGGTTCVTQRSARNTVSVGWRQRFRGARGRLGLGVDVLREAVP